MFLKYSDTYCYLTIVDFWVEAAARNTPILQRKKLILLSMSPSSYNYLVAEED